MGKRSVVAHRATQHSRADRWQGGAVSDDNRDAGCRVMGMLFVRRQTVHQQTRRTSHTESPRNASAVAFQLARTSFPSRLGTGGSIGLPSDIQNPLQISTTSSARLRLACMRTAASNMLIFSPRICDGAAGPNPLTAACTEILPDRNLCWGLLLCWEILRAIPPTRHWWPNMVQ